MNLAKKHVAQEKIDNLKESPMWDLWLDEFENVGDWLCPDIDSIELLSDPYQFANGKQIVALVNRCDIAEQVDQENGLVPNYNTTPCLDDLTSK